MPVNWIFLTQTHRHTYIHTEIHTYTQYTWTFIHSSQKGYLVPFKLIKDSSKFSASHKKISLVYVEIILRIHYSHLASLRNIKVTNRQTSTQWPMQPENCRQNFPHLPTNPRPLYFPFPKFCSAKNTLSQNW